MRWLYNARDATSCQSAKTTCNVVFGFLACRLEEHLFRGSELNQVAELHVSGVIAATCGLLHVVSNDNDGVICLQLDN